MATTTEFYYKQIKQKFQQQTKYPVQDDSDLGIRMKIFAGELSAISTQIDECERQMFPQTATGSYLERHGACRDLYKKSAMPAQGILRFSCIEAAASPITIPQGTLCSSSLGGGMMYQTTAEGTIEQGATYVDIPAQAQEVGLVGNAIAGKIDTMVGVHASVNQVTNQENFSGGRELETDETFRRRLLSSYINVSTGANMKFYEDFAMSYPEVSTAKGIFTNNGTQLNLYVSDLARNIGDGVIAKIQQDIESARELNINVVVKKAKVKKQPIALTLALHHLQNSGIKISKVRQYLENKIRQLGIGESINPYFLANGFDATLQGIVGISFTQPSTIVNIAAYEVLALDGEIYIKLQRI